MPSGQRDTTSVTDGGTSGRDPAAESAGTDQPGLFAVTSDPVLVHEIESGTVVAANDAALELLDRERAAVLGAGLDELGPDDSADTETRARTHLDTAAETGENRFEWRIAMPEGDRRRVEVSVTRATFDGADRLLSFLNDVTPERSAPARLRDTRAALLDLHEVTVTDRPIGWQIDRMLEIGCDLLDVPYGYVTELDAERQVVRHARGGHEALAPGAEAPRDETYCRRTVDGEESISTVTDAAAEMGDDPAYERFGLACYLGGTIEVDGETYGTVCFAGDESRERPFSETERRFVDVLARRIGAGLETDRRTTELETRRRRLEAVFDTPDAFVGFLEPDGTLLRANQAAWEFVDSESSAHVGDPFWEGPWFSHDDGLQTRIEACVERASDGEPAPFEAMHIGADGRAIDVEGAIRPVRDAAGDIDVLLAHGNDVTARERRLQEVKRHRERLGTILDNAPLILYVIDRDGTFTESRGAGLAALGLEPGEVVGESAFDLYDDYPSVTRGIRRALDGETVEDEVTIADQTFQTYHEPMRDEDGAVTEVIGVSQDVTELKRRERELQDWKNRLQTVVENAPMILFSYDPDGTVTMSQGKGLDAYGLEPGELVGTSMYDVFADDPTVREDARRAADGERVTATREVEDTIFKSWYRPIERDGEVVQVIGAAIDITQQKRQEHRIEALSDATNELIEARSPEAVGETVMEIAEDVLRQPLSGIWTYDDEAGVLEPLAATDRVLDRMDADHAASALPTIPEGTVEMDAFENDELRVVDDYTAVSNPAMADVPLGTVTFASLGRFGQLHVGSSAVEPPSQANRNLVRILAGSAEAALERAEREQELAAYREELERSNESLQQFAYIASHDLQEPLRMVSSYVDLLESEYADQLDAEADEYIEFAVDGAQRMQSMIEALLQYSRVQTQGEAFSPTDAAAVAEDARRSLGLLIEEVDATVTVGDLPTVQADRSQLGQVFQNLLENAIEHGGEPPRVEITATVHDEHCEFAVADNGPGIHADDRETIFEIFKQGHRRDDGDGGTGIGLAVCRRIVQRHGGEIWVESTPGEGATFRFTIPDGETGSYTES